MCHDGVSPDAQIQALLKARADDVYQVILILNAREKVAGAGGVEEG